MQVVLCPECQTKIRDLENHFGAVEMGKCAAHVVAQCSRCSRYLPDELRIQLQSGVVESSLKDKT